MNELFQLFIKLMTYSLFQLRRLHGIHVGMECGSFGMDWGNAQFHYVITACAAATLLRERDAALSRRLKRVHWCREEWSNACIQVKLAGAAVYAKAK